MKLKDEMAELVETRIAEVMRLFEDADRISVNPELIKQLYETIPLIEDIKTEVSDISRQVHQIKKKEEKPKEDQPVDSDPDYGDPYDPPHSGEEQKMLDDLDKMLKDWDKFQKRFRRYKSLPGASPLPNFDEWLRNFAASWYLWKEIIEKKLLETMKLDPSTQQTQLIVRESNSILEKLSAMDGFLSAYVVDIKDVCDQILDKLTRCCDSILQYLSQLIHDTSVIDHKIDVLNPEGQVTQELGVEARIRSVQSELGSLRGLLRQPIFVTVWDYSKDQDKGEKDKNDPAPIRRDPKTGSSMGIGAQVTDPNFQCIVYEYTQNSTYDEITSEGPFPKLGKFNTSKGDFDIDGHFYVQHIKHHLKIKKWRENTCEPGVEYDVVETDSVVSEESKEVTTKYVVTSDSSTSSGPLMVKSPLNGVGVPEQIPDYILGWLKYRPDGGLAIDFWKQNSPSFKPKESTPDTPLPPRDGGSQPTPKTTSTSDENHDMVEVRVYGSDYDTDDKARVTAGPGFGYRDRVLQEISVRQQVTRDDFKGAVAVNGYIPGNWDKGVVVSASFQSSGIAPKNCVEYKVTYGWWIFKIQRQ